MKKISKSWILWIILTIGLISFYTASLVVENQEVFSPGQMTHGHHQIEMSCATCHEPSTDNKPGPVMQTACMSCHAEELKESDDSHPKSKFTDPRNSSRVKELDARLCITCHTEHKNEITHSMGVTIPQDFCFKCHQDVAEDRSSHKGMEFQTCGMAGCHNYHDNRSLYEDFLEKHIDEDKNKKAPQVSPLSLAGEITTLDHYPVDKYPHITLGSKNLDAPGTLNYDNLVVENWSATSHAKAGVNCTACHQTSQKSGEVIWIDKPDQSSCKTCHTSEVEGFLSGKHGMRLQQGLSPMTPAMSLLPMKNTSHSKELSCVSCHSAHKFDVKHAAVESCLNCHNDGHSNAYKESPHFISWNNEVNGLAKENTGVSCATCHMPRKETELSDKKLILSEHNQNMNLRPNDKMLRSVCMSCHGLGFSMNALADEKLIKNNFNGLPQVHVQSINLVKQRILKRSKSKEGSP